MKLERYKLITVFLLLLVPSIVLAEGEAVSDAQQALKDAAGFAGFSVDPAKTDIYQVAANWINGFLSVFMLFFVFLLVSAGFSWMTSGGNSEKVSSAKETIKNALIGMLVAFTAYILSRYVLLALASTTGINVT